MEKNQRASKIKAFLENECGLVGYRLEDMVADASVRKYFRVVRADGTTAVLMDDESPYTKIRKCTVGFSSISLTVRTISDYACRIFSAFCVFFCGRGAVYRQFP